MIVVLIALLSLSAILLVRTLEKHRYHYAAVSFTVLYLFFVAWLYALLIPGLAEWVVGADAASMRAQVDAAPANLFVEITAANTEFILAYSVILNTVSALSILSILVFTWQVGQWIVATIKRKSAILRCPVTDRRLQHRSHLISYQNIHSFYCRMRC